MKIKKEYNVHKALLTKNEFELIMEFANRIGEKQMFSTIVRKVLVYHAMHPEYDFILTEISNITDIKQNEELTLRLMNSVIEAIKVLEENGVDFSNVIERINITEEDA